MNWLESDRIDLEISLSESTSSNNLKSSDQWNDLRKKVLKRANFTCRYCGGRYKKYLHCIHIDRDKTNNKLSNLGICCKPCFMVTNIDYNFNNEVVINWSKVDQLTIIRRTVDFIIKNGYIPNPKDVDPQVKKSPISILELTTVLGNKKLRKNRSYPKELENYKVFFTKNFDTTFIEENVTNSSSRSDTYMFIDTDDYDVDSEKLDDSIDDLEVYSLNEKEKSFLDRYFSNSIESTYVEMTDKLDYAFDLIKESKDKEYDTSIQYHTISINKTSKKYQHA